MEKSFMLNIVTPDREFFSGNIESLIINTPSGEAGILYHTLPMVTVLKSGTIKMKRNGRWMEAVNSDGFVSVTREKVTVLSQNCEWPHETDSERGEESRDMGDEERKAKSIYEYKTAKAQLAAQFAKLKIKNYGDG